jgi:Family of unknown function (DUF6263)
MQLKFYIALNYSDMKKINLLLIILMAILGMIVNQSCESTKSSTATKLLKFNFEKGKGYDYEMNSNIDQEIMGQPMQMDMSAYYSMEVMDDDGTIKTITTSIDRFKMKMGVAGINLDIDTDKPLPSLGETEDGKDPMKILNAVFGAIKGQKFSMKVDAEGKVHEVSGFENMAKSIVDSMGLDEQASREMIVGFNDQFNGDKMKEQFERSWYIFPNKSVKVGDSWQKKSRVTGQMGGDYTSNYKVTAIEGDMVTLVENTKVESAEEGMNIKGTIKGEIVVDSRLGLVVSSDQDTKLTIEMNGNSIELKGKTKIKGKAR